MPRGSAIIHPSCARTCSTYTRINMRGAHISVHTTESGLFTNNFTCNFEPAVAIKPGTRFARQTRERLIPGVSGCQTAKEGKRPSMEFGILPKISSSYTPKIYEYQYFCLTNIEPTLIHIMFPNWSYVKIITDIQLNFDNQIETGEDYIQIIEYINNVQRKCSQSSIITVNILITKLYIQHTSLFV